MDPTEQTAVAHQPWDKPDECDDDENAKGRARDPEHSCLPSCWEQTHPAPEYESR